MKARFLIPLIGCSILGAVFVYELSRNHNKNEIPSPLLERQGPTFALPSLADPSRIVGSETYAGDIALVNVWATWCVGCRAEHDFLMTLAARDVVPIFGLNWRDQRDLALNWLAQLGDPYIDTAFDQDGRIGIDWGVYGAPETFLIAADGTVLYKHISPLTEQVWQDEFWPRIEAAREATR